MKTNWLLRSEDRMSRSELLVAVAVLLLSAYVLTPRFWEPGGESWPAWAAARILRETGGFPVFSRGPLYVVYLQLFSLFHYPQSVQLEYFVTHLFAYATVFLMLRRVLSGGLALLLACAWIPSLAVVEGGATVAGIGFLALYLSAARRYVQNGEYFPISLVAATLCHSAYLPFLVGHAAGTLVQRLVRKRPILACFRGAKKVRVFPLVPKAGLAMIVILTILLPSSGPAHNHMQMDPAYVPIPLGNALTVAFFQIGNWKYVERTVPRSLWIYQDWHFTNERAFGGATTILQAVLHKPDTVLRNVLENVLSAIYLPMDFVTGGFLGGLLVAVLSCGAFVIGWVAMVRRFKADDLTPVVFSASLGTVAVVGALLLTCLSRRYVMALLPMGLFIVAHIGPGLHWLAKSFLAGIQDPNLGTVVNGRPKEEKIRILLGSGLILAGILLNEWSLRLLFSPNGVLSLSARLRIWSLDILLIAAGVIVIWRARSLAGVCRWLGRKDPSRISAIVALGSAICVLFTAAYPHGRAAQVEAVLGNRALLSGAQPRSMAMAYRELLGNVDEKTTVLALEYQWIEAFADVNLSNVHQVWSLPPFPDPSGNTERMLNGLDEIWVSPWWSTEEPSVATQAYLRYRLHVAPFLEQALARGWTAQEVDGYGRLYRRPLSE